MRSAACLALVSVSITVLLLAATASAADNPNVTKTEVLAGTAANSGTMMSHADASLTRLVVVDSEQRLVLSYAVDSSGQLRLRDRVALGEGELPERATQIERYTPPLIRCSGRRSARHRTHLRQADLRGVRHR